MSAPVLDLGTPILRFALTLGCKLSHTCVLPLRSGSSGASLVENLARGTLGFVFLGGQSSSGKSDHLGAAGTYLQHPIFCFPLELMRV